MSARPVVPVNPGDRVRMRKPHPCGGFEWVVTRVGMDIGLQCDRCQRRVMLPRQQFEKRLHQFLERAPVE